MQYGILIVSFETDAGLPRLASISARVYRGRGGRGFTPDGAADVARLYAQITAARQDRGELPRNHYSEARPIALDVAGDLAGLVANMAPRVAFDRVGGAQ